MPYRRIIFSNSQFYHIYNRTIADEVVFQNSRELNRALSLIDYYRYQMSVSYSRYHKMSEKDKQQLVGQRPHPLIEIHAFCFMPNHFHFLLRQLHDNGISRFLSLFQNGMAKYINLKNDRHGSLFCNMFKAKHIENEQVYLHVSRYIHLNPVTAYMIPIDKLSLYPNTSFLHYNNMTSYPFVNTELIINDNRSINSYNKFVFDQEDYQKKLKNMDRILIDT